MMQPVPNVQNLPPGRHGALMAPGPQVAPQAASVTEEEKGAFAEALATW